MTRPFILLDRDGTLIEERHYLAEPDQVQLIAGATGELSAMEALGFGLALISNQSGINRGYFTVSQLDVVHGHLKNLLSKHEVELDGIYCCPHLPNENCRCRKPAPGLALRAASELGIDLQNSLVVGDKPCDIELGENVGATTCLVRTGYGAGVESEGSAEPDYTVDDLRGVVPIAMKMGRRGAFAPDSGMGVGGKRRSI